MFLTFVKALSVRAGDETGFPSRSYSVIPSMGVSLSVSHLPVRPDEDAELFDGADHRAAERLVPRSEETATYETGNLEATLAEQIKSVEKEY